ncbi:quinon protein alcohol dehydrogenase-like superfamily [Hygrophoropsis aurantiaca]|uniref:Quinon protein alcohol dehydrogenase-like superfamily n=1 Tax=Hygrophoropsis aurantiaca TaxID=72124 RepID=A0ACB8ABX0_9AGAM|nr:quinon protein alcohol dehydrogenase-like superfamily [Hygrophoropsis aurantiaca]
MSTSASPELEGQAPQPPTKVFEGHTGGVNSVAFFKDGKRVISGSSDSTIQIWNVENGKEEESMPTGSMVKSMLISPDEKKLVIRGSIRVTVWDLESREVVWKIEPVPGSDPALSPDGQLIAVAAFGSKKEIVLLDVETRRIREPLRVDDDLLNCLAFSPDGIQLAAGTWGGKVRVFDVATGKTVVEPFETHAPDRVRSMVFTSDGQQIITTSGDKSIRVWNSANGRQVGAPMLGHTGVIYHIALCPDKRRLASSGADRTVRVWDTSTRRQLGVPFQAQDFVDSVAWSPNGLSVVAGDRAGNIYLWTVPPLEDNIPAPVLNTSSPLLPIVSRSRTSSASSSILNLPIGPLPTPPQPPKLDGGTAEENDWEYSSNESFDSVFDLPADGTRPAQRRKRKRRRAAPVASSSTPAPPISAVPSALPAITSAPRRSPLPPLDQTSSPPAQRTGDAHAVAGAPAPRIGALRRLWGQRRTFARWTRRKPHKNRNEPLESQPVEPSPASSAPTNDIEMQPRPIQVTSTHNQSPADHAEAVSPKSRISRLLTRSKRRPANTSASADSENIEMHPPPSARRHGRTQNPSSRTRPRRQSQSEVVNVAAGRLDQRLAASSNKWTDKIDWLDYICFCMCCPWNKVISESDSERQGNRAAGAGAGGSSGSSSSESVSESPVNLNDIY